MVKKYTMALAGRRAKDTYSGWEEKTKHTRVCAMQPKVKEKRNSIVTTNNHDHNKIYDQANLIEKTTSVTDTSDTTNSRRNTLSKRFLPLHNMFLSINNSVIFNSYDQQ